MARSIAPTKRITYMTRDVDISTVLEQNVNHSTVAFEGRDR